MHTYSGRAHIYISCAHSKLPTLYNFVCNINYVKEYTVQQQTNTICTTSKVLEKAV